MLDVFPNYNPIATQSDGSCSLSAEEIIIGCTNLNTWTYDPNANFEDGSCLNDMTIGALGQGGIVFHIDYENQTAYVVSQTDLGNITPSSINYDNCNISGDFLDTLETGYQNTLLIVILVPLIILAQHQYLTMPI